jgi:hypothetical protein
MGAAQDKPFVPIPKPAIPGPQLASTRKTAPAQVPGEAPHTGDQHSFAAAMIIAGIALIGALTFAGSVATWLLLRNTGVNWMFQPLR